MGSHRFDAIVVGTGQSGPSLAVKLAGAGKKVAVVERGSFGGTCVNAGCIPTKTLIASARVAHVARRAAEFGVVVGDVRVDMKAVHARMAGLVAQFREGLEGWLQNTEGCTVFRGHARFEDARSIRVGADLLSADQIFINVGGRPAPVRIPGIERIQPLTSTAMLELDTLPEHLVIIGGSYVALEFAQMFRRFGSEVTVVERGPRLLKREDDDVSAAVREILEGEGIRVLTSSESTRVEHAPGPTLFVRGPKGEESLSPSHLLTAVGRVPNTADLGLDQAGVRVDARGFIEVDEELRTSVPGIWALGDCNGRGAFTHTSYNDHQIVAANLLEGGKRRVSDRIPTYAVFTDPPLGRCGLSEREVRASGRAALVAKLPMARVGRARERSETLGFMKILVDAQSESILGATFLGIEGDEIVHVVLAAMYAKAPYTLLKQAMHIHPTVAELIPTLLEGLAPLQQHAGP